MNYRQWKKNYKKKHGYNPPLKEDKRKQAKLLRKTFTKVSKIDINLMVKNLMNGFSNMFRILGDALNNVADSIQIK